MAPTDKNPLIKQREDQRFQRAIEYVLHEARSIKKINSRELLHLNQVLTDSKEDPWRYEAVEIQIPTGKLHKVDVISTPINRARDILGNAVQMVGNQECEKAAFYAYSELVLAHLFNDANRRTAVLAVLWILESGGLRVDPHALLKIPLGDLRNERDRKAFIESFHKILAK